MSYIAYEIMQKLKSVNFSFPFYEHSINNGMIFYYEGDEYYIGGFSFAEFSETDIKASKEGCWLPTETELFEWLELVGFDVFMRLDAQDHLYRVEAQDTVNGMQYSAKSADLAYALAILIFKICKSNMRPYVPQDVDRLSMDYVTD